MNQEWLYEDKPWDPEYDDIPPEYFGFIYKITDKETGEVYIGQKRFHKTKTLPITKTRKRKQKLLVESDWRTYYSSSKHIQNNVSKGLEGLYKREILRFGYSKGDLHLLEIIEQLRLGVLWNDGYLNGIINIRLHKKHISNKLKQELLENAISLSENA